MFLVGVGASAGGLDALQRLLRDFPANNDIALVVIQHLSMDFESLMRDILSRETTLPVVNIEEGMRPQPGTIYLMMPGSELEIIDGHLRLFKRERGDRPSMPIDRFFVSMARDCGANCAAVVLSGTGSDGSRGLRDVFEMGGVVLVQSPDSAHFDGMPLNAIQTGMVEHIAPPEELPGLLENHLHKRSVEGLPGQEAMPSILELLERHGGVDFNLYKPQSVQRRIRRRMNLAGFELATEFLQRLHEDHKLLEQLYQDLLIDVTSCFRDVDAFDRLKEELRPLFVERLNAGPLRIWSAACSTGAEAFSLAIISAELCEEHNLPLDQVKIFATDVNPQVLEQAASGLVTLEALKGLSQARQERFLKPQADGTLTIRPSLRALLTFARHNLLRDPPFTQLDLVTCRNMLIYLRPDAQQQALARISVALRPGGLLLLGRSEQLGALEPCYETVARTERLYRRNQQPINLGETMSATIAARALGRGAPPMMRVQENFLLQRAYDALLTAYVPPSLLLDAEMNVLHVFGGAAQYLQRGTGRVSHSVHSMVGAALGAAIGLAVRRVIAERQEVIILGIRAGDDSDLAALIDVRVSAISLPYNNFFYLVCLEESTRASSAPLAALAAPLSPDLLTAHRIHELEEEVRYTRAHLQATIEELGTSNEELQAINEEMLVSHEELQSTNEELHSVNEELYTVNAEHQFRIEELTVLNTDLDNLLKSVNDGVIFLDERLSIRKFTAAASRCFHLLPQDVGRSLQHISGRVTLQGVFEGVQRVLRGEPLVELNVTHLEEPDVTFLLRIRPYLTESNQQAGAVLSLIDISQLTQTERRLEALVAQLSTQTRSTRALLDALQDQIYVYNTDLTINDLNLAAARALSRPRDAIIGHSMGGLAKGDAVWADLQEMVQRAFAQKEVLYALREHPVQGGGRAGFFEVTLHPLLDDDGVRTVILIKRDVSERFDLERRRLQTEADLAAFLRQLPIPVARLSADRARQSFNLAFGELAGGDDAASLADILGGEVSAALSAHLALAEAGQSATFALQGELPDGTTRALQGRCFPFDVGGAEGKDTLLLLEDITTQRHAQERERDQFRQELQQQKIESLGLMAGGIAHDFNNMLTVITGNAALLARRVANQEELAASLRDIQEVARRATDLCAQMLTYAGHRQPRRQAVQLNDLVQQLARLLEISFPKGVALRFEPARDLPLAALDRAQFDQVLMNLLTNAAQSLPGGCGGVRVSTHLARLDERFCQRYVHHRHLAPGDYVCVEVSDDGVGMTAETLARIFEPFFSQKRGHARGLGLATVLTIVHAHDGAIDITSQHGEGTCARVYLPVASAPAAPPSPPSPLPSWPATVEVAPERKPLILCADDEAPLLKLECQLLEQSGFEVLSAAHGDEALALFVAHQQRIAAAILDVTMPRLTGLQCRARIRAERPELPIILTSGYFDATTDTTLSQDPHTSFLQKPWSPEELVRHLKQRLAQ
jgi:two-component system CheB/CheR fusion protein